MWARRAGNLLPAGAPVFDVSAVRNISGRHAIEARSIRFDNNVMLLAAGQDDILDQLAAELNELAKLSSSLNVVSVTLLTTFRLADNFASSFSSAAS